MTNSRFVTFSIALVLLSALFVGQAQTLSRARQQGQFLVDKTKPYVYLQIDHLGPRTPRNESEPKIGVWVHLHNNCTIPIIVRTFGVPPGSPADEIGLLDNVVANPRKPMGDGSVSYGSAPAIGSASSPQLGNQTGSDQKIDPAVKAAETMPYGYVFAVSSFATLAPGQSVYFSLPINHVSDDWHAEIPFRFSLKVTSSLRGASNLVSLYREDLPLPKPASTQMTEQAHQQASNIVRSKLHLRPDQFLDVQRDGELEQSLALATVGWRGGPVFIYRIRPTGIEIREKVIVNHLEVDADSMYIVAVRSVDGSTFRLHGFGLAESLAEFERLMTVLRVHVASPDQAESLAHFYRMVNPENYKALTPIVSLFELKQATERQCQSGAKSFDAGEKAFTAWWKHAEPLYAALPFQQRAIPHGSGYFVEWIVISSPSAENCGGAPLMAQLEVGSDGQVGKVTFTPLQKGRGPTVTTH